MSFSDHQIYAVEVTERVCSIFSLVGTAFIITTFLSDKSFNKPINRLVFYASWGNIMSNIATLIAISGIRLGADAPLCQFQAFLNQCFLFADALWTFAMAFNVYLTFFRRFDAKQLRSLEWKYILFCYGTPFIIAFSLLFVRSESRGKVYGSAVIWCWVRLEWDFLRVAVSYGPVWLAILATFAIYLSALKVVLQWRRELLKYTRHPDSDIPVSSASQPSSPVIVKTVEYYVTREPIQESSSAREPSFQSKPAPVSTQSTSPSRHHNRHPRQSRRNIDGNRAAISYCKVALLFFVATTVTWVPSTVNRVVTVVHPDRPIFWLAYTSALVLPLQGFWNAIIYIFTSLPACKSLLRRITTALHIDQMSLRRNDRSLPTVASSDSLGLSCKKQSTDCSDSVQELHLNTGDGLGIATQ